MKQYIAWGISNIIVSTFLTLISFSTWECKVDFILLIFQEGLKFLNFEAKLCHNKVNIWSVFVNKAGQWKLGELEYMNSVDNSPPSYVSDLYRAPGHRQSPL